MSSRLTPHWAAVLVPFLAVGCTATGDSREELPTPAAAPAEMALSFGESDDTASSDGPELFSKPASNPNPKTLSGIYERTGYGSEDRSEDFLVISNDWKTRIELRPGKVVAAIERTIKVGGATDDEKTLYAFVSSPLTVETWGVRIEKAQTDKATWAEYGVDCSVEIPDETWPYCTAPNRTVPEGYSMCVFIDSSLQLSVKKIDGSTGVMGKKIRN